MVRTTELFNMSLQFQPGLSRGRSSAPLSWISRHRIQGGLCNTLLLLSSSFIPTPPCNSIIIPTTQNHIRVNTRRFPLKAVPKHDKFCAEEENSKFKMAPLSTLHWSPTLYTTPPLGCIKDTLRYSHWVATVEGVRQGGETSNLPAAGLRLPSPPLPSIASSRNSSISITNIQLNLNIVPIYGHLSIKAKPTPGVIPKQH